MTAKKPRCSKKAVFILALAELKTFWGSVSAGVALLVFLGLLGFFFYNGLASFVLESLRAAVDGTALDAGIVLFSQSLANIPLLLMLVTPLVTMRSLAAFRRGGGLDFFQTLPVSDTSIVAGQYLAAVASLGLMLLLAMVPFIFLLWGGVGSWPILLVTFFGLLALASAFAAVGLMASAAFTSPVGAGLATLGALGLMWVLGWAPPYAEAKVIVASWQGLAFAPRVANFVLGVVQPGDFVFFFSLTIFGLYGARSILVLRRFNGAD